MKYRLMMTAAAVSCLVGATPSSAQDYDWTGFYVGVNAGGSWGDTSLDSEIGPGTGPIQLPPVDVARINQVGADDGNKSGFTGGIQGGYNWQSGSLLLGLETDLAFMDVNQHRTNTFQSAVVVSPPLAVTPTYTLDQRVKTDWIWTVRPRIGFAAGPWLLYGTGGIATSEIKLSTKYSDTRTPPNAGEIDRKKTKTGWTAGLGGAYAFGPNLSVRGEWLYADFGKVTDTFNTSNGFATLRSESKVRANLLRLGMDYKF